MEAEQSRSRASSEAETKEEELLAQLFAANEDVLEALKSLEDAGNSQAQQQERERQKSQSKVRTAKISIMEKAFMIAAASVGRNHAFRTYSIRAVLG